MGNRTKDLLRVIERAHVMGEDGLRDYYAAKGAINSMRSDQPLEGVRHYLKNYNVGVFGDNGRVRVVNYATSKEYVLQGKDA